ncbi:MAG: site-specific integrase, partial [Thermoplasmata archaeon]
EGIERMVVHCELDLGLRRIEVLRLRVSDFRPGRLCTVRVLGKGRHGGKPREVHWHPDTAAELEGYLRLRDAVVAKAKAKNPEVVVPDSLLVYERAGAVLPYKKSALDNVLAGLARRTGLDFTHHTLRRTCGRMMYRADPRVQNIANILGHSDTKTTSLYLGLDLEDQSATMLKYAQYQKAAIIPESGIVGVSQENGGPCGI